MKRAICIFLSVFFACLSVWGAGKNLSLTTVVIDAGHGGKDPGAVSKDRHTYEKTLVLDIARRFADNIRNGMPGIKVVMTRSTDEFVELRERAAIANKAGANLFISLHINANGSASPNGYSVHILGQSSDKDRDLFAYNMDVVKRENSVILLEDDYKTNYQGFDPSDPESYIFMQLMQNAYLEQSLLFASIVSAKLKGGPVKADRGISQNPFYVLWKTGMPAVLIELGFISNPEDLAALRQASKREDIADRLFEAFHDYKDIYDGSVKLDKSSREEEAKPASAPVAAATDPASEPEQSSTTLYGTQIFASSRLLSPSDKSFLGYKPEIIKKGSLYKYIIGTSEDRQAAVDKNMEIRKQYPASFMVEIRDGDTVRFKP